MNTTRRAVLLGLGATALTGCATPGSAVLQVLDAYRTLDKAKKNYPVTRAQIDAQPAGVLGAQVEGGLKGLVVWQRQEGGMDYWRSGNNVLVVTKKGRLVRTSGFPQDVLASRPATGVDPLGTPLDPSRDYRFNREMDWLPDQYGVVAEHRLRFIERRQVDLLGAPREVASWEETIRLPSLRRKWEQRIEVDAATGEVLRSIQHVGPETRLVLELLKAPAQGGLTKGA